LTEWLVPVYGTVIGRSPAALLLIGARMSRVRSAGVRVVCALAAAALGVSLAGCGSSGAGSAAASGSGDGASGSGGGIPDGPITIGMVAEQSGEDAAIGNYQVSVQKALAGYINAHGGIAGHRVKLVIENNQSDAATAVSAARKLAQQHVAGVVYGGLTSSGLDQVLAVLAKAKIPAISPNPETKYDNPEQYPYFFTDNPTDPTKAVALAGFAKKHGWDTIGQLGDSTPYATSLEKHFPAQASKDGLHVVKTVDYPSTATNMTTQLAQLEKAGTQTLGLWCQTGCGKVFDGLRQLNWSPHILTTEVVYYSGFDSVKNLGAHTVGICPVYIKPGKKPNPKVADILKAVAPKVGGLSAGSQGIVLNADSWLILKYGIEKAHSLNGQKIRTAIESINQQSFSDPDVTYTFSTEHHAGFQAAHPDKTGICGYQKLGALKLPILAK
jgi:branched-chain amino acid transport system substrate-binding protein